MKRTALIAAALAVAGWTTGCHDTGSASPERVTKLEQRVTGLEQRVTGLEQSNQKLESELKKIDDEESNRRGMLQGCLTGAVADYERGVMETGKKEHNGTYSVPGPLLDELGKRKQDKIEECKLLYSK